MFDLTKVVDEYCKTCPKKKDSTIKYVGRNIVEVKNCSVCQVKNFAKYVGLKAGVAKNEL